MLTRQLNAHKVDDGAKLAIGLRIYQEYKSFKYEFGVYFQAR